jgi:hypothetical protein
VHFAAAANRERNNHECGEVSRTSFLAGGGQTCKTYHPLMAMEFVVQRLQIGDVILADHPEHGREVEAMVVREIDRMDAIVRVTLRVEGYDDFVKEWPLGKIVTVVRGP